MHKLEDSEQAQKMRDDMRCLLDEYFSLFNPGNPPATNINKAPLQRFYESMGRHVEALNSGLIQFEG